MHTDADIHSTLLCATALVAAGEHHWRSSACLASMPYSKTSPRAVQAARLYAVRTIQPVAPWWLRCSQLSTVRRVWLLALVLNSLHSRNSTPFSLVLLGVSVDISGSISASRASDASHPSACEQQRVQRRTRATQRCLSRIDSLKPSQYECCGCGHEGKGSAANGRAAIRFPFRLSQCSAGAGPTSALFVAVQGLRSTRRSGEGGRGRRQQPRTD